MFYFSLPDKTKIYLTAIRNEVSTDRFLAKEYRSADPDDMKDQIQNEFNEAWDEIPGYSKLEVWKNTSHNEIILKYENFVPSMGGVIPEA